MNRLIVIILLCSCGKQNDTNCKSGRYMQLRCQAEVVERYYPATPNEFEMKQCLTLYNLHGCYNEKSW